MTKKEQFNLVFYKKKDSDNDIIHICTTTSPNVPGPYSNLAIIDKLEREEIEYIIENINWAQNNEIYDPAFLEQQGFEDEDIIFEKPNFIIHGFLTIHMDDLKMLLQEWLAFIKS